MDYDKLINDLTSEDDPIRESAYQAILMQDEGAVDPLIDIFYAGVNEATGLAMLDILNRIGGYEVRLLLEDLTKHETRKIRWRDAARNYLAKLD